MLGLFSSNSIPRPISAREFLPVHMAKIIPKLPFLQFHKRVLSLTSYRLISPRFGRDHCRWSRSKSLLPRGQLIFRWTTLCQVLDSRTQATCKPDLRETASLSDISLYIGATYDPAWAYLRPWPYLDFSIPWPTSAFRGQLGGDNMGSLQTWKTYDERL